MNKEQKIISYSDIEDLSQEIKKFITDKNFELFDEGEFLMKLEKILWDNINKGEL